MMSTIKVLYPTAALILAFTGMATGIAAQYPSNATIELTAGRGPADTGYRAGVGLRLDWGSRYGTGVAAFGRAWPFGESTPDVQRGMIAGAVTHTVASPIGRLEGHVGVGWFARTEVADRSGRPMLLAGSVVDLTDLHFAILRAGVDIARDARGFVALVAASLSINLVPTLNVP